MSTVVFLSGSNGFLGRALSQHFGLLHAYKVIPISRSWPEGALERQLKESAGQKTVVILGGWGGVQREERANPQVQLESLKYFTRFANESAVGGADVVIGIGSQAEYSALNSETGSKENLSYGAAKLAARELLKTIRIDFELKAQWVRIFSIYGKEMDRRWILPRLADSAKIGEDVHLGSCGQYWGFLHVSDACRAIEMIVNSEDLPFDIDLGGEANATLRSQIESLAEFFSLGKIIFEEAKNESDSIPDLQALTRIGWRPRVALHEGFNEILGGKNGHEHG